jgi:hypothetical protein
MTGLMSGPGHQPTLASYFPLSALPRKRTSPSVVVMSALCQKRTFCAAPETALFDHHVGAGEYRLRHG